MGKQRRSDEHPRPHIDVPKEALSDPMFSGGGPERFELLGRFVHMWCHAVWKKDPKLLPFLSEPEITAAMASGFVIVGQDGTKRLTGPKKDRMWLLSLPRTWMTYAIQSKEQSMVKVGKTTDPDRRLEELQTGSAHRLSLLGLVDRDIEKEMHHELRRFRVGGEWFLLNENSYSILFDRGLIGDEQ